VAVGAPGEPDWYEILGVDSSASDAEIGRAFRALARRFHPDAGSEASGHRFSDVARAYEVLGHPNRRADYDRYRSGVPRGGVTIPVRRWAGTAEGPAVDPSSGPGTWAEDFEVDLSVSLVESVTGTTARVRLPQPAVCGDCAGSGRRSGGPCGECGGDGGRRRQSGSISINLVCATCGGSGARPAQTCGACAGRGWREQHRELTVRVPAGVGEGTRLRLRSPSGGAAGFARVRLQEDRWFAREGRDLVLRLPLTVAEAALGTAVTATLPDGPAAIAVPAGTAPGTRIRVPGRGVPGRPPGDLVAAVEVVLPLHPDDAERAALEALRAVSPNPRHDWPAAPVGGHYSGQAGGGSGPATQSTTTEPDQDTDGRYADVHDAI